MDFSGFLKVEIIEKYGLSHLSNAMVSKLFWHIMNLFGYQIIYFISSSTVVHNCSVYRKMLYFSNYLNAILLSFENCLE